MLQDAYHFILQCGVFRTLLVSLISEMVSTIESFFKKISFSAEKVVPLQNDYP